VRAVLRPPQRLATLRPSGDISGSAVCNRDVNQTIRVPATIYGHSESKKTQEFIFRSALRPNQISFSHGQDPFQTWKSNRRRLFQNHRRFNAPRWPGRKQARGQACPPINVGPNEPLASRLPFWFRQPDSLSFGTRHPSHSPEYHGWASYRC